LAHEIRNPLASLSGAIELLGADLTENDANSRKLLRIVGRETARLDRLANDFLCYAASRPIDTEPVALLPIFDELAQLLAKGENPDVALEAAIPGGLQVAGNPDQVRQIFWNLVLNAAQSEPEDGRVFATARRLDSGEVEVVVVDRGGGIPAESLERIFEPFFTTRPRGTGLGLALVHRMVEAHRGQIRVSSDAAKGTTVRVVLPTA
jgi:two-component system sensor histidine kinase PilS (NtrC family)